MPISLLGASIILDNKTSLDDLLDNSNLDSNLDLLVVEDIRKRR